MAGGSQENGVRPGTENVPGIVGFGKAAELRLCRFQSAQALVQRLRDRFEEAIRGRCPEIEINGDGSVRVGGLTNLQFPGIDGQALVNQLDLLGIECSQSSACTRALPEPSHVLTAMGLGEGEAYSSVRFCFSVMNSPEELDTAVNALCESYQNLRNATEALIA